MRGSDKMFSCTGRDFFKQDCITSYCPSAVDADLQRILCCFSGTYRILSWNKEMKENQAFMVSCDLGPPPPPSSKCTITILYLYLLYREKEVCQRGKGVFFAVAADEREGGGEDPNKATAIKLWASIIYSLYALISGSQVCQVFLHKLILISWKLPTKCENLVFRTFSLCLCAKRNFCKNLSMKKELNLSYAEKQEKSKKMCSFAKSLALSAFRYEKLTFAKILIFSL